MKMVLPPQRWNSRPRNYGKDMGSVDLVLASGAPSKVSHRFSKGSALCKIHKITLPSLRWNSSPIFPKGYGITSYWIELNWICYFHFSKKLPTPHPADRLTLTDCRRTSHPILATDCLLLLCLVSRCETCFWKTLLPAVTVLIWEFSGWRVPSVSSVAVRVLGLADVRGKIIMNNITTSLVMRSETSQGLRMFKANKLLKGRYTSGNHS